MLVILFIIFISLRRFSISSLLRVFIENVLSHLVMSNSLPSHGLQPTRLLCPMGIHQARILEWIAMPPPGDLPTPGTEPSSPAWQADYLPYEPSEKPKNTGESSLSLLQQIFSTEEDVRLYQIIFCIY